MSDATDERSALCPQCYQPRGHCEHTEGESMFGPTRASDDGGFDLSRPTDRLLAAFDAHGVSCGSPDEGGWVDDNIEVIYKALLKAGWTPPADA